MNKGLVSVIMPAYNASFYIAEAIQSVILQTYKKWELIVIDDCSEDSTPDVAKKYSKLDRRIRLIQNDQNLGTASSRNAGVEEALGDWIAFLDCDDLWLPDKLKSQIEFLHDNNLKFTYSSYYTVNQSGEIQGLFEAPERVNYEMMLKSNRIGNLTGIYSVEYFGKLKFKNIRWEDYLMYLYIVKKLSLVYGLQMPLAKYRIVQGSYSRNKFKALMWQWNIYRSELRINIFKSLYYLFHYTYFGLFKYRRIT